MSKTFRAVGKYDPPADHHANHSSQRPSQRVCFWQCEECDQQIPEYADLVNRHHASGCSLHSSNVPAGAEAAWLKGLVN